jgi:arylsulfatase A-like enzyme
MKAFFNCLFICLSFYAELKAQSSKPNILILFTDDHTYHAVGALGNKVVKTPHMDELVKNGTTFTRASCLGGKHGALCVVSRAGIMTGRYLNSLPGGADVIPTDHTMMPEQLKKQGYKTFATGKWHNDKATHFRAFDEADNIFFGGMHFPNEGGHEHADLYHYDPSGQYPQTAQWSAEKFSSTMYADAAIAYLNQNKQNQQPFFAYVAFTSPHDPRTPPAPYDKMYDPNKIPLPKNFLPRHPFDNGEMEVRDEQLLPKVRTPEMIKKELASYYGMISEVDAQIGRIIQTLKANGQYENTLIIFAGDNGLAVGSHGLVGKQSVYEHSMRVPLVMVGPGIPKNKKVDALCYLSDVFPTVCGYLGIEKPASSEGKNLLEAIQNPQAVFRQNIYYKYRDIQLAVRTHDDWKLIKYNIKGVEHQQLFNLKKDPWETKNLAMNKKYHARLAALTETLKAEMAFYHDNLDLNLPNWGKTMR